MFTKIQKLDVMNALSERAFFNQRLLAEETGLSLGVVNKSLKELTAEGYIDENSNLTMAARCFLERNRPRNAVILAAGFGMRMVPINTEFPKGLLTVYGEPLIERIIQQLREAGVYKIHIVVGFMKERYEYLIDKYDVDLIVNTEYAQRNNLHSLCLAADLLDHTYVVPCDIWCAENPFRKHELYSWYMVNHCAYEKSTVRVNRKRELVAATANKPGNTMIGISYLMGDDAQIVRERLVKMDRDSGLWNAFWEDTLCNGEKWLVRAKVVDAAKVVEINTYEQLRELDENSNQLKTDAIQVISQALSVRAEEITDISVLKKGMTNRSFLFNCRDKKYIMRIPGEGTSELIDRSQEAQVYKVISGFRICDDVSYINPDNGYKITEYLEGARVCNPDDQEDLCRCMARLREFHNAKLRVEHTFDIFERIDFYQSLWGNTPSVYRDYMQTRENVFSLRPFLDAHKEPYVLTHIDAVPDNFLFVDHGKDIRLIDWEYAGMQDPHVDIAMFCIYALYDRTQADRLIDLYFAEGCPKATRIKIYCYIAACGLLWSNWCEYKRNLGVEFGEYSLRQYRYAKDYYRIVRQELEKGDI